MRAWIARFVLPVVGLSVVLGGCSDPEAATPTGSAPVEQPQVRQPETRAVLLDAADPAELALTASQQVFAGSPVAVLAEPSDDAAVRATQAAAADLLGAPALLVGGDVSEEGVASELTRLGVQVVVAVAAPEPDAAPGDAQGASEPPSGPGAVERSASSAGAETVRLDALDELGAPEGEGADDGGADDGGADDGGTDDGGADDGGASEPTMPADAAEQLRADVDTALAATPGATASGSPSTEGLREVLALTDPQPGQEAAIATLRAGGAVDLAVPGGDIAGSPEVIEAIDAAQALAVVGVGPTFGDVETFAWRVAAAEDGTLLPTGDQKLLPARYVTVTAGLQEDPADVVARADAAADAYAELDGGPVVPTVVVPVGVRAAYAGEDGDWVAEIPPAEVEPVVTAAREAGHYVLLDVASGTSTLRQEVEPWAEILGLGGVGVALHPEDRRPRSGPGHEVPVAEVQDVVTYIEGVVTNQGLPPALVAVHQTRPESVVDRAALAETVAGTEAVEVVLVADRTGAATTTDWVWQRVTGTAPEGVHLGWSGPTLSGYLNPDLVPVDPAPLLVAVS